MKRRVATLIGMTAVAVAVLGPGATTALATLSFEASTVPVTVEGGQLEGEEIELGLGSGGTAVCGSYLSTGMVEETPFSTLQVHPEFSNCKAFGFLNATVSTESCDLQLSDGPGESADLAIACAGEEARIVISVATCEAEIGGQELPAGASVANDSGNLVASYEAEWLSYTVTEDGFLCPFPGVGEYEDGTIIGAETVSPAEGSLAASFEPTGEFEASTIPVSLHGAGVEEVSIGFGSAGSATCEESTTSGALGESPVETVELHPEYTGCEALGFVSATVATSGCNYVYGGGEGSEVDLSIACEVSASITVTAATCEAEVGPQDLSGGVVLSNESGHLNVAYTAAQLTYTVTNDGFLCPFPGVGEFHDGTISGAETLEPEEGSLSFE